MKVILKNTVTEFLSVKKTLVFSKDITTDINDFINLSENDNILVEVIGDGVGPTYIYNNASPVTTRTWVNNQEALSEGEYNATILYNSNYLRVTSFDGTSAAHINIYKLG